MSSYKKRFDGRKFDEIRPMVAKVGIVKNAKGSAYFKIGKTEAYAAVYGPRELHPKFLQDPKAGKLRCSYNMLPFCGSGERIRPGGNRRSREICLVTEKALAPVMDLSDYPNSVVDVFIEIFQSDSGTRCAGITAASMALADAGFKMKDLPVSVAVGVVDGQAMVDLIYDEESYEQGDVADIPIAVLPRTGEITLLQEDGIVSKEKLMEAIETGKKSVPQILEVMKKALKAKFKED